MQSALRTSPGIPKNHPVSGHPSPGTSFLNLLHNHSNSTEGQGTHEVNTLVHISLSPAYHILILNTSRGNRNVTHSKAVELEFCMQRRSLASLSSRIDWDTGIPGNDGETPLVSSRPGWAQNKRTLLWDSSCAWIPEAWNSLERQVSSMGKALFYGRGSPQRGYDGFSLEDKRNMCRFMVWGKWKKKDDNK